MKGWSGYQNSPINKKIWPPTKGDNTLEYQEELREANERAIAKQKALYDSGKITKEQFESDKKEISKYVDY